MGVEPDQLPDWQARGVDPSTAPIPAQIPTQYTPYPTAGYPAMAPPPKPSRRNFWILGGLVVVVLAIAGTATGAALTGSGTASTATTTSTPVAQPTTVKTVAQTPSQRFVDDVMDTPGLKTDMTFTDIAGIGEKICDAIGTPGITRENLISAMGTTKLGPEVGKVLVDAAARSYCPEKSFSSAPGAVLPPSVGGDGFTPGTYEVGTGAGQMPPGKYKSTGPDAGSSMCYFARLKNNDGAIGDIIDNDISRGGQSLLTVKATDGYVKISGCTFTAS